MHIGELSIKLSPIFRVNYRLNYHKLSMSGEFHCSIVLGVAADSTEIPVPSPGISLALSSDAWGAFRHGPRAMAVMAVYQL